MLYNVLFFRSGDPRMRDKVEATSPKQAVKLAQAPGDWSHAIVYGKSLARIENSKGNRKIDCVPMALSVSYKGKVPSILLVWDGNPEFYKFETVKRRDEVLQEIRKCITSMSAGSAKAKAELTGIIVSLDEIKGTKSSSTSKKTSSGYAIRATCREKPTLGSIDKIFGTDSADDTGLPTWLSGSNRSHSKRGRTFLGTVKDISGIDQMIWPGINSNMVAMKGKTYKFVNNNMNSCKSLSKGWYFLNDWIDTSVLHVKVKRLPEGTTRGNLIYSKRYAGQEITVVKCNCGCGGYHHQGTFFHPSWLEACDE